MNTDLDQQLTDFSLYERAILMYCVRHYFTSSHYTTRLPLAEMLPDLALIFDQNTQLPGLQHLMTLTTPTKAGSTHVFKALTYDQARRELVAEFNPDADLKAVQARVDN